MVIKGLITRLINTINGLTNDVAFASFFFRFFSFLFFFFFRFFGLGVVIVLLCVAAELRGRFACAHTIYHHRAGLFARIRRHEHGHYTRGRGLPNQPALRMGLATAGHVLLGLYFAYNNLCFLFLFFPFFALLITSDKYSNVP